MDDYIKVFINRGYISIYMYMCSTNLTYGRDTKFMEIFFLCRINFRLILIYAVLFLLRPGFVLYLDTRFIRAKLRISRLLYYLTKYFFFFIFHVYYILKVYEVTCTLRLPNLVQLWLLNPVNFQVIG